MPRKFFHTTAELTIRVVEAVFCSKTSPGIAFIETFCDLSNAQAIEALGLACDLGLICETTGTYSIVSPLARFFSTPKDTHKASVLRIVLESYDVFVAFRERLFATGSADQASQQIKALLDLDVHKEDIRHTLISLATYSGAIVTKGGGQFAREKAEVSVRLSDIAANCANVAAAETWVRDRLGPAADVVSRNDVILPLASSLLKAIEKNADDAATEAGNAFESYLVELAARMGVSLAGATGINSKLDKFRPGNHLPKKIVEAGKFIGQVRNAAGHGVDTDVGSSWTIQVSTALDLVSVACSLVRACHEREINGGYII